ncbi:MAG TPA: haloacid dehalogenase type II [Accumulibacter sp.]|jgi:2-haloacid dehalogenase|nr:haloacid dehalogenase type II [Accumulibacter sp.]HQC78940.1 haloacid dehalogenase type II [Accumulibacter sp.]
MSQQRFFGIEACVFDAYGTLFDVGSVARGARHLLGQREQALSDLWRDKQLQYTWLRGLAGQHADFWQVTSDALDFSLATLGIKSDGLHERLMDFYLEIAAYPDVAETLRHLRNVGMKLAILSNGTPRMLRAAVDNAGFGELFDAVLSVESVGVFKPHPAVYDLAARHFPFPPRKICFLSSYSWDASAAKARGLHVLWLNRCGKAADHLLAPPDGEIASLPEIVACLGHEREKNVSKHHESATNTHEATMDTG